jgi:hypothetical protein
MKFTKSRRPATPGRNATGAAQRLASALSAAGAMQGGPGPVPPSPAPPEAIVGHAGATGNLGGPPGPPAFGATDGLGAGQGGLAVHPNLKLAKLSGYEPRHSSKHR